MARSVSPSEKRIMKLICPSCSAVHSAEAWLNDAIARQCLKLAGELQYDVSSRCFSYLALFRPPVKALTWRKVLRLLSELKELIGTPHIQYDKNAARPNSAKAWGMAMDQIIENPPKRLPLKSHGYLKAIAYDYANDMDVQKEVRHNRAERNGTAEARRALPLPEKSKGRKPERLSFDKMKEITEENYRKKSREKNYGE